MRVAMTARGLILATTTAGLGVVVAGAAQAADVSLATVALLGAAVVLTELFQVSNDESSGDPDDAHHFSFSSAVHLAAVAIAGPWVAALVAAFGVVTVDKLRGSPWVRVLFNAAVFALAAGAGGLAFELAGGHPGTLDFPSDLAAVAALTITYSLVNSVLVSSVVALTSNRSPWAEIRDGVRAELPPRAAESGLGIAAAFCALTQPWAVVPLLPLGYAVYQAHARLVLLRRETTRALETFANVVDERDSSTFHHSARVSEHVRELAEAIGMRPADVARLSWAGRLHDLGKIAVDSAVLRKPAALNDEEWRAMRRHPRLSARRRRRLLRDRRGQPADGCSAFPRRRRLLRRDDERAALPQSLERPGRSRRNRAKHRHAFSPLGCQGVRRPAARSRPALGAHARGARAPPPALAGSAPPLAPAARRALQDDAHEHQPRRDRYRVDGDRLRPPGRRRGRHSRRGGRARPSPARSATRARADRTATVGARARAGARPGARSRVVGARRCRRAELGGSGRLVPRHARWDPRHRMGLACGAARGGGARELARSRRSEERRVGKECRSRWSP